MRFRNSSFPRGGCCAHICRQHWVCTIHGFILGRMRWLGEYVRRVRSSPIHLLITITRIAICGIRTPSRLNFAMTSREVWEWILPTIFVPTSIVPITINCIECTKVIVLQEWMLGWFTFLSALSAVFFGDGRSFRWCALFQNTEAMEVIWCRKVVRVEIFKVASCLIHEGTNTRSFWNTWKRTRRFPLRRQRSPERGQLSLHRSQWCADLSLHHAQMKKVRDSTTASSVGQKLWLRAFSPHIFSPLCSPSVEVVFAA